MNLTVDQFVSVIPSLIGVPVTALVSCDESIVSQFLQSYVSDALIVSVSEMDVKLTRDIDIYTKEDGVQKLCVLIKDKGQVEGVHQIQSLVVPVQKTEENDMFNKLRTILNLGLLPIFETTSVHETESDTFVQATRKKFNELSALLQNLQEKVQVPNLLVSAHVIIKQMGSEQDSFEDSVINDANLLNEVTNIVNGWIRQIQTVTKVSSNLDTRTSIVEEIQFWTSLEISLSAIEDQLKSVEVKNSLNLLNRAKRFQVTLSFTNDTNLVDKMIETKMNLSLLKDLPIDDMLGISYKDSEALKKFNDSISSVFHHLRRIRTIGNFPLEKALLLTELVLKDITTKFSELMGSMNLLTLDIHEFSDLFDTQILDIFGNIDLHIKYMVNLIRELLRKRHEKFIIIRINQDTIDQIKQKLDSLREFRIKHENLLFITRNFLHDVDQESKLIDEYNRLAVLNPLDFSKHGMFNWATSEKLYVSIHYNIQSLITKTLNDLFCDCAQFKDFVLVAEKYKYLDIENTFDFSSLMKEDLRLKILETANEEIKAISKFDLNFGSQMVGSLGKHLHKFDGSSNKGSGVDNVTVFMRCLSITDKIRFYEQNLEVLVGGSWTKFSVGKKLSDQIEVLKQRHDPETIFNSFISKVDEFVTEKKTQLKGKVLKVTGKGEFSDIEVNFNSKAIDWKRDVVFFQNLGLKIPVALLLEFQRFSKPLPLIQDLDETISTAKRVFELKFHEKLEGDGEGLEFLMEADKLAVIEVFKHLGQLNWDDIVQAIELSNIEQKSGMDTELGVVLRAQESVTSLAIKCNTILKLNSFLNNDIYHCLKTCSFEFETIKEIIERLESTIVDKYSDINREKAVELNELVDKEISGILGLRCKESLEHMSSGFLLTRDTGENEYSNEGVMVEVSLVFRNQQVELIPSLEDLKVGFVNQIDRMIQTVEKQQLLDKSTVCLDTTFLSSSLAKAFTNIQLLLNAIEEYHKKWCKVDFLTGLDVSNDSDIRKFCSDSFSDWLSAMKDVVKLRDLFDHEKASFGNCVLNLNHIQSKTYTKFEIFQKHIINRFGEVYQTNCQKFLTLITKRMNSLNFDTMNSKNFIDNLIVYINTKKEVQDQWKTEVFVFSESYNIFPKFGFQYPSKWVHIEQIESQIAAVQGLVDKKTSIIQENKQFIESRISGLVHELAGNIEGFRDEWTSKRPISGEMNPILVLSLLNNMSGTSSNYFKLHTNVLEIAKELEFQVPFVNIDSLSDIQSEIGDFKQVWSSINSLHDKIQQIRKLQWKGLKVKDIRMKLEALLEEGRSLPIKIRQYAAFDDIQQTTKNLMKQHKFLVDLKNENLKDRHWKKFLALINYNGKSYHQFVVGDIYDLNLSLHEDSIKAIVSQANNEHTLEESVDRIKQRWAEVSFEYFNFDGKYKLIKSWNKLFEFCSQDLNELASMRNSSSYDAFEQSVTQLEAKLNSFYGVLDTWIEVQRQWVYLQGMFGASKISNILPVEAARFNNLTYGLFDLMKKVYKVELAVDVLMIGDLGSGLEKLSESFTKLRRSLSDFLEKQRETFGRFYFIGNEDLLELVGAGTDFSRINPHINKLFCGISSLVYGKDVSSITAVCSGEGEVMQLRQPVSLIKYPNLVDWLRNLEIEVKLTLVGLVQDNLDGIRDAYKNGGGIDETVPCQVITLCCQIVFTEIIESGDFVDFKPLMKEITKTTKQKTTKQPDKPLLLRRRRENLLVELIHQQEVLKNLSTFPSSKKTILSKELLYYFHPSNDPLKRLIVNQMNNSFVYGLEYLGVPEKLVHTPLIDTCYLAMTQAISQKLGGSPFGPAGTGKTESIKSLGDGLGKMVTVFCCDDSFDFQAMSRIFLGLCKTGCWGCFDEFNRLDEKLLAAVSSQIESIQLGLKKSSTLIELSGKPIHVNPETGIFVTMNPGYVGRNELPENLKKLFRSFSMDKPDKEIIAEVLLASQGFEDAGKLAGIIVPFFTDLEVGCSEQTHYDFGLRSLRTAIDKCGRLRVETAAEESIVLESITQSITPKLIKQDKKVFLQLKQKYFEGVEETGADGSKVLGIAEKIAVSKGLNVSNLKEKLLQLYQLQESHHGIIMVGESGSGKSTCRSVLLEAMKKVNEQTEQTGEDLVSDFVTHVIDAKVLSKEKIYGHLDSVTREWTDGLFTSILRKIKVNLRGEQNSVTWIVFDGDIDPEWAENLNSVLDDNKVLTLPNGERLELPSNVRILFETDSLRYTTLATISRCGMIWFDGDLSFDNVFEYELDKVEKDGRDGRDGVDGVRIIKEIVTSELLHFFLEESKKLDHIMDFNGHRLVSSFVNLLVSYLKRLTNENNGFDVKDFVIKSILLSAIWSFSGDSSLDERIKYGKIISGHKAFTSVELDSDFIDYDCTVDGEWRSWDSKVIISELEPHKVADPSTVIQTTDTVRHESLIRSILNQHKPLLLCGPPGSGKTMTFLEVLKNSPNLDVLQLNFSKDSSPELLMKSLMHHCEYQRSSNSIMFVPKNPGKWVVVFCDEINLPGTDKYGCQTVISLMRQLIEHKGFWNDDMQWVSIRNIQFVGACNSPKDPGRQRLPDRFLRHVSLVMVDYPGRSSLEQIYETFNAAVMKLAPDLRGYCKPVTKAMLDVYFKTKEILTPKIRSHYIYSPRELTRWTRGLLQAMKRNDYKDLTSFLRLWYHEGLRLFYDRLVKEEERQWTKKLFADCIKESFPFADIEAIMADPVLFTDWLSDRYESVNKESLYQFISHRLATFSEEEFDVELVLYEELLTHALRIDRVLRQPQGHMILAGDSTSGKTTLTKFVAWINGLKVVQLQVYSGYTITDFDGTLREILLRCAKGEQICFLIDEASIIETSFIERMNTLLANSEIPGLFEGEEFKNLMNVCLEESQAQGLLLDSNEELYSWFSREISANLHVVFAITDLTDSYRLQVISSPALFNRCVLSYMGKWSMETLVTVGSKKLEEVPVDIGGYIVPEEYVPVNPRGVGGIRDALMEVVIFVHRIGGQLTGGQIPGSVDPKTNESFPGQFLSFINHFITIFTAKQSELEDNQRHTTSGLNKLRETVLQVAQLKEQLSKKQLQLSAKDKQAREMLNTMLSEQNEAERKQEFSIEAQKELHKQEIEIETRRKVALKELEEAEPAILSARRGVQNIKKQHLTEIRSMANPPAAVKMTMESVCILTGYEVSSWRDVQLAIRKDDFIPNIVNYDNESQLTAEMRDYMDKTYLTRPDFNFETVNRASKACGPLLQWVRAQLTYSSVLNKVGPLKEEVEVLERGTRKTRAQVLGLEQMVKELEVSIEKYKNDYSSLIRETENIKMEMESVQKKVEKSRKLMENLELERGRWKKATVDFGQQNEQVIGSSILAAGFLVYCGGMEQKERGEMMGAWREKLGRLGIKFEETVSVLNLFPESVRSVLIERGSSGGDVLDDDSLVSELFLDNSIIITSSKIPLIIDPMSKAIDLIGSLVPKSKLVISSFLSDSFIRDLENGIRFGGVMLIKDFEYYNPILDAVLRNEIHRNGGRQMITIGDHTLDYNPNFKLFLHTRDPYITPVPFVSSRVTTVSFSTTSKDLQSQVLNLALRFTDPETEAKRSQLLYSQSQKRSKLLVLEKELLNSLAQVEGNILDDDSIINHLETLKTEAGQIDVSMKETVMVLQTIEHVRNQFSDVAAHCSLIFDVLKRIGERCMFYQFSIDTFKQIFVNVLKRSGGKVEVKELYKETFGVISPSLKDIDKVILGGWLIMGYYGREIGGHFVKFCDELWTASSIASGTELVETTDPSILSSLSRAFGHLLIDIENDIPTTVAKNSDNEVIKVMGGVIASSQTSQQNPTQLMSSIAEVCSFLFSGTGSFSSSCNLDYFISSAKTPLLLVSAEGYDPSFKVEQLAATKNVQLEVVSLGSREGIEAARQELQSATNRGSWLLIQNIQMSPEWLNSLEQVLATVSFSNDWRLFLGCGVESKLPSTLISSCQVLIFENEPTFKDLVRDTFGYFGTELLDHKPNEYKHIYFLLVWFHCIVLTMQSYVPASLKKKYDINDADFRSGIHAIDKILGDRLNSGSNIAVDSIPFEQIAFVIGQVVYGGKINDEGDLESLRALAGHLFSIDSFESEFNLLYGPGVLRGPEGISVKAYLEWIERLPEEMPLTWISLENDDDIVRGRNDQVLRGFRGGVM